MRESEAADNTLGRQRNLFGFGVDHRYQGLAVRFNLSEIKFGEAFAIDGVSKMARVGLHLNAADIPIRFVEDLYLAILVAPIAFVRRIFQTPVRQAVKFTLVVLRIDDAVGGKVHVTELR